MKKKEFNKLFYRYNLTVFAWYLTEKPFVFLSFSTTSTEANENINKNVTDLTLFNTHNLSINYFLQQHFPLASTTKLITWKVNYVLPYLFTDIYSAEKRALVLNNLKIDNWIFKGRLYNNESLIYLTTIISLPVYKTVHLFSTNDWLAFFNYIIVKHGTLTILQRIYYIYFYQQLTKIRGHLQTVC